MDIYTATEQAYKNGKSDGERGAMVWKPGADIPAGVNRALVQKNNGTIILLERPYLERAVRLWGDISAWCEVLPFAGSDIAGRPV